MCCMLMREMRGKLILIEGLDRTGKTTQVDALVERLRGCGLKVVAAKFPNRESEIGQLINRYLTNRDFQLPDQAVHLLFSANRWEYIEELKRQLNDGYCVVLDRYVFSGVAYSSAKGTPGMDLQWCLQPDKGLLKPDLTLFLTNEDRESIANRAGFGEERYEDSDFQLKVKQKFHEAFDAYCQEGELRTVNVTGKGIEQVSAEIWDVIEPLLHETRATNEFKYF